MSGNGIEQLLAEQSLCGQDNAGAHDREGDVYVRRHILFALVALSSFLIFFLGMSRVPQIYDEGLILTGAMRVSAGQMPHRDFYANYGPAQFYLLAALFKAFSRSLIVERVYDAIVKALVVVILFKLGVTYFHRSVAAVVALLGVLWIFCLFKITGTPVIPVSFLNLLGIALMLPVFERQISGWRAGAAGFVAGAAFLFRYDTGFALLLIGIVATAVAHFTDRAPGSIPRTARALFPYLVGFAGATLPAAVYFLAHSPLHPVVHDILLFPAKYYHRARNLPFPRISIHKIEDMQVYLPLAAMAICLGVLVNKWVLSRARGTSGQGDVRERRLFGCLCTFGLLTFVMFFKGYVRMEVEQMYLCILPALLLGAALIEYSQPSSHWIKIPNLALVSLFVLAAASITYHQLKYLYPTHRSVLEEVFSSSRSKPPGIDGWCKLNNPLTRGLCFLTEDDRMRAIEFIDAHTTPRQFLYVGLSRHDRIFANDNLIYFASERMPATHWSHFDPGLQSRYDIQAEMVGELKRTAPPYLVLDSEFESMNEPNDSSKSSEVTLLDGYIHGSYHAVEKYGDLSIWERNSVISAQVQAGHHDE